MSLEPHRENQKVKCSGKNSLYKISDGRLLSSYTPALVERSSSNHKIDFSTRTSDGLKFRFLVYFSLVVTISALAWFGVERSRRVEDARGGR